MESEIIRRVEVAEIVVAGGCGTGGFFLLARLLFVHYAPVNEDVEQAARSDRLRSRITL